MRVRLGRSSVYQLSVSHPQLIISKTFIGTMEEWSYRVLLTIKWPYFLSMKMSVLWQNLTFYIWLCLDQSQISPKLWSPLLIGHMFRVKSVLPIETPVDEIHFSKQKKLQLMKFISKIIDHFRRCLESAKMRLCV